MITAKDILLCRGLQNANELLHFNKSYIVLNEVNSDNVINFRLDNINTMERYGRYGKV